MTAMGIGLTSFFFIVAKYFAKVFIHFIVITSVLTLGTIGILAKIYKYDKTAVVSVIALFLYVLFLFHSFLYKWDTITNFIKSTRKILKRNSMIYTIPIAIGFIATIFTITFILVIFSVLQLHAAETLSGIKAMLFIGIQGL